MKKILPIISCVVFVLCGCAYQQDIIYLEERLESLEMRNQELQQKLTQDLDQWGKNRADSEQQLRSRYAGVHADIEGLQQEIRIIRGRVEEIEYLIKRKVSGYEAAGTKQKERLDEIGLELAKMDQRVVKMEQYLSLEGKNNQPADVQPSPPVVPTPADEAKKLYADARQAYDNGELDRSRQLFQQLIRNHPKSENADNAQFWIGESYYREKWFERAILEYQTVIEKYPKGNKVPAAMLKQGMALLKIGEKSSARLILQELVKKYPKASESKIAAQKLKEF